MFKTVFRSLARAGGVVVFGSLLAVFVSFARVPGIWEEPTQAPPAGNAPTPLNVGSTPQTKDGGLWINLGGARVGFIVDQGNVGIGNTTPGSKLVVSGEADFMNNRVKGVATPTAGTDAVNRDYLKDYVDAAGGSGGGSVVLYYKTDSNNPRLPVPSCPSGWNQLPFIGYGPHYLGIFGYDWYYGGSGGSGGGFGGSGVPTPPPAANATYVLNTMAIGSDSVCSQNQTSTVSVGSIYMNAYNPNYTELQADACGLTKTGATVCNRCIVCTK